MGSAVDTSLIDGVVPEDGGGDGGAKAARIREDIEHTRSDITDTIHALQDKLNPGTLREQAKETLQQAKEVAKHEVAEGLEAAKEKVKHELHEAKQAVRDATIGRVEHMVERAGRSMQEAGGSIWDTVRSNPFPVALITIGAAWLMFGRKSGRSELGYRKRGFYTDEFGQRHYYYLDEPRHDESNTFASARDAASSAASRVSSKASAVGQQLADKASAVGHQIADKASTVRHQVGDTASSVGQSVAGAAGDLAHRVGEVATNVGQGASHLTHRAGENINHLASEARTGIVRAERGLARAFEDNPLAIGAAVLAAGAVVGLSLPSTRREDELLGDLRDRLAERAQEYALSAIDAAENKATDAARSFGAQQTV